MSKISRKLIGFIMATVTALSFSLSATAVDAGEAGLDHVCTEEHDHGYVETIYSNMETVDALAEIMAVAGCPHDMHWVPVTSSSSFDRPIPNGNYCHEVTTITTPTLLCLMGCGYVAQTNPSTRSRTHTTVACPYYGT